MAGRSQTGRRANFLANCHDGQIRQDFRESQTLQLSTAQQLREVTLYLDPSNNEGVKTFYDHMPATIREYDTWKREAARSTVKTAEAGDFLTTMFTGEYTEEEVYEEFTSEGFTNELEQLRSEIAHNKVIDGMKLAQDAAREFASWQQFHTEVSTTSAVVTSTVGSMSIIAGFVFGAPALVAAVPVAVPLVAFQLWFGSHNAARNNEGRSNLTAAAITVSDITESIQQDVRLLDEMEVYASNVATCKEKVERAGRINRLQRDKIVISARKMKQACDRYKARVDNN